MTKPGDLSLDVRLERIESKIDTLTESVTILKVKAGLYGAATGAAFTIIIELLSAWSSQ